MKSLVSVLMLAFLLGPVHRKNDKINSDSDKIREEITKEEITKKEIFEYLEQTKESLEKSVEGLSEEQMTFKAGPDRWSIAECVEHIITVEGSLKGMLEQKFAEPETLELKADVNMTDDEVVAFITDRSDKIQTSPNFVPSGKFTNADEALDAFKDQREDIVDFLKDTDVDMRNYVNEFPFGKLDAYQTVLFLAGHTARHTLQIEEVKQNANYPSE